MKELLHIGTIEFVSLPDDNIEHVPAKVDTGADNSAIWASNMHLEDGKLLFNFFAPGSAFYSEEPVVTNAFRTTTVKNSFGQKEFRYKIQLRVRVGDHTLRRWFTLADRSRNAYPILLGKNFLRNMFIVDVSKKNLVSSDEDLNKVLIFTDFPEETAEYLKQVKSYNTKPISYECTQYDKLQFCIDGSGTQVVNTLTGRDLADYGFVYLKNHHNNEFAKSIAEYLQFRARPFADQEFLYSLSASKLSEYMRLSCFGLSVPATVCAATPILKKQYRQLADQLGTPFVMKEIHSDKGRKNYLVGSKKDFDSILAAADPGHDVYLVQKFIPNDGYYRLYVTGKDVSLAIWRTPVSHKDRLKTHLNKPAGSANASNISLDEVPGEAEELALRAADCMARQIAGVDMLQDNLTGKWYILEANNDPQIRSGSFIDKKAEMVAKYFETELNR